MDGLRLDASKVRLLMLNRGMVNQKELADLAGVSENTISAAMRGGVVTGKTVASIAVALEASVIDVIDTSGFAAPLLAAPGSTDQRVVA